MRLKSGQYWAKICKIGKNWPNYWHISPSTFLFHCLATLFFPPLPFSRYFGLIEQIWYGPWSGQTCAKMSRNVTCWSNPTMLRIEVKAWIGILPMILAALGLGTSCYLCVRLNSLFDLFAVLGKLWCTHIHSWSSISRSEKRGMANLLIPHKEWVASDWYHYT